jgi:hypothetical protein
MKSTYRFLLLLLTGLTLFWSCQKEMSIDTGAAPGSGNTGGTPGGSTGGGTMPGSYGWSFTGGNTAYYGCVDTAYYETVNGIKTLSVEGSDSAGNEFAITLVSLSGNFSATTYTPATGAVLMFSNASSAYSSATATSFSLKVSAVNDTLLTGTFTASLSDVLGSGTLTVTNGKLKALIGKPNPCANSTTGSSGGTGNNSGNAVFSLVGSGGNCANADIQGTYMKGTALTQDNKVMLDVDVTSAGAWNIATGTVNGIKFSGSGMFSSTGTQTITLEGSGTPTNSGATNFPVTAGSSNCSFPVSVDTIPVAPCNPTNNSVTFSVAGIGDFAISYVSTTVTDSYTITGNGNNGDLRLTFAGSTPPAEGVYNILPVAGSISAKDVSVYLVASNILWQANSGKLYVSKVNGKVVATICEVSFSGSLGGPSYNTKVTAKMTER